MKIAINVYKFRLLLIAILLLLLTYPYLESSHLEKGVVAIFYSLVLLAGVYAATTSRRTLTVGIILVLPVLIGEWYQFAGANIRVVLIGRAFDIAFNVYITVMIYFKVFQEQRVTSDTIAGAVCVYFLMGIAWCSLYTTIESGSPGGLHLPETPGSKPQLLWTDILFFSFMTLTTTGYGDITPTTMQMRSLAIVESVFGVLYLAIMVARLVSMYQEDED